MTCKGFMPRIIALGMQGYTAQSIAQRVGCGESYAAHVLTLWRSEGNAAIQQQPRKAYRRIFP